MPGAKMVPDEIAAQLHAKFPCREHQIEHLVAICSSPLACTPLLNIHGLTATGKSSILRSYLPLSGLPHTIVNVRECITVRHLLETIVATSLDALDDADGEKVDRRRYARTENISALCVNLGEMLHGRAKFLVVLDAIDKLREGGGTLIAALARLGEVLPNLSLVVTTTLPLPSSALHSSAVGFLNFPPYTRSQLLAIINSKPLPIVLASPSVDQFPDYTADLAAEDDHWLWARFTAAVYDALSKHTGRDLVRFQSCAIRLWRPFVDPIVAGQFGTRDFSRLMVNRRHLFQVEDSVLDRIISPTMEGGDTNVVATPAAAATATATAATATIPTTTPMALSTRTPAAVTFHNLPYYTTHLLIAAYLASYNPSRTDVTYFMKYTDKRRHKRRAPSAASFSVTSKRTGSKHRKISRHLLTPSPFSLERLLAIFRALLVEPVPQVADLYTQIATLTSMRLLARTGGMGSSDALEIGGRWRVNFEWEYARALGRSVNIEVGEYLVGGID